MRISVIIPTLNEAAYIEATLATVLEQSEPAEIIVVDGGSEDETVEIASRFVRVMEAPRGRARQMNAGAEVVSGDVLVFLHADTKLPENGLIVISNALSDRSVVGGCFKTSFDHDSFWMRIWSSGLWMRWHRFAFGDRAQFVRRSTFKAIGGFPDQPMFEDLDLVRQIRARGQFVFLNNTVETSARRFRRHGTLGQQLRNGVLWIGWLLGFPSHRLKRYYSDAPDARGQTPAWRVEVKAELVQS